jgi:hypothetical protein
VEREAGWDFLVAQGYGKPETRRLPYDDYGLITIAAVTGWLHIYFRDTRYTVTSTDCRVETQLSAAVKAGDVSFPVGSTAGFFTSDGIWIERAGTNEEQTTVIGVGTGALHASVSMGHLKAIWLLQEDGGNPVETHARSGTRYSFLQNLDSGSRCWKFRSVDGRDDDGEPVTTRGVFQQVVADCLVP